MRIHATLPLLSAINNPNLIVEKVEAIALDVDLIDPFEIASARNDGGVLAAK